MTVAFSEEIYHMVQQIPPGSVCTYGQIALLCGHPRAAGAVGTALKNNPYGRAVPCHRVLNCRGELAKEEAFGGSWNQRRLLLAEGVPFLPDGRVDLARCMWLGPA